MITVKHTCGHTQETNLDRLARMSVEKNLKTQEQADQFVKEQIDWLESYPCPRCYCAARGIEPNPHPTPES